MDNQLPSDSQSSPMDTSSETDAFQDEHVIELAIYPPLHHHNHDRMLQADTLRWNIRLPSNSTPKFPGYYISNDGDKLVRISASEPSPGPSLLDRTRTDLPIVKTPYDPSQRERARARQKRLEFERTYSFLLQATTSQPPLSPPVRKVRKSVERSSLRPNILVPSIVCHASEPLPPSIRRVTKRSLTNPLSNGVTIRKAAENSALYTTKVSWGHDPVITSKDRIIMDVTNEQELEDDIEGFNMGIETGSSLSWVYKTGYKQLLVEDTVLNIKEWNTSNLPKPDSDLAQAHPCVDFSPNHDVDKKEYNLNEILRYGDGTVVAAAPFRDAATFHGTGQETQVVLTALGALAVNRPLMLREYDGLLGLSPRAAAREEGIHPSVKPVLQQLLNSKEIKAKIFYLTFSADYCEASLLSFGGIREPLRNKYNWSPFMSIVSEDQDNLTWSLYLDSVDIVLNNGNIMDTLSLDTSTFETESEKPKMHFDSGTSHSLYTEPLINFFIKNELILKEGFYFFCRTEIATAVSVSFNFRSGCMTKTWNLRLPGTMFGEPNSQVPNVQGHSVKQATIASMGGHIKDMNIWGNKHMRSIGIGFNAESNSLCFGIPLKKG